MYNLRYHIASLVAVFLALSVGLLMGTIVVERGVLDSQKTTLVQGLQDQYASLRTQSQDLRSRADVLGAFVSESAPRLVQDVLRGRTVLVIADPGAGEAVASAVEAVRQAGGSAGVVTFTAPRMGLGDAAVSAAVRAALGTPEGSVTETAVVSALAREIVTADDPRVVLAALEKSGAIRVEGLAPGAAVSGAIDVAAWDGKPDGACLALAKAVQAPGRYAAAAATTKRPAGIVAAAAAAELSAVEDVESPLGRVSVVWVLAGRASGRFGPSKDAVGPYPTPLFPAQ